MDNFDKDNWQYFIGNITKIESNKYDIFQGYYNKDSTNNNLPKKYPSAFEARNVATPQKQQEKLSSDVNESRVSFWHELNDFSALDKTVQKKIKKGAVEIDFIYDFHGYNTMDMSIRLRDMINECYEYNIRKLLIITGKGSNPNKISPLSEVLIQAVNHKDVASLILAYGHSHIKHGGEGAYYIFVKRNI